VTIVVFLLDKYQKSNPLDDILEVVFRYQFSHNESAKHENYSSYYLSIGEEDTDPNDAFMKRFHRYKPSIKKISQSIISKEYLGNIIIDKDSGERGIIFRVSTIKWINNNEIEVEGGYYESLLSASGNIYRVIWDKNHWRVKDDKLKWMW